MLRNTFIYKFVLFLLITINLTSAHAAEEYQRKSISALNEIFLISTGKQIETSQKTILLKEIKEQIYLDQFDYNNMPENFLGQFPTKWKTWKKEFSIEIKRLEELKTQITETEKSIDEKKKLIEQTEKLIDKTLIDIQVFWKNLVSGSVEYYKRLTLLIREDKIITSFNIRIKEMEI